MIKFAPALPADKLEQEFRETFAVGSGVYRVEITLGRESSRGGA